MNNGKFKSKIRSSKQVQNTKFETTDWRFRILNFGFVWDFEFWI